MIRKDVNCPTHPSPPDLLSAVPLEPPGLPTTKSFSPKRPQNHGLSRHRRSPYSGPILWLVSCLIGQKGRQCEGQK